MEHPRHGDERIAAEAADWFLRLRDKEIRPDRAAFAEWLTRSPVHLQEFLEVATLWSTVGTAGPRDYDVDGLIAAARAEQTQRKVVQLAAPRGATEGRVPRGRARGVSVGIAASLLLALGLWGGWALLRPSPELSTAVGEQRTVTLSDGSVQIGRAHV